MANQVYIGNFPYGQNTYFSAFNIDNNAFQTLYNFYVWRGQAKKKRGTSLLGRLQRQLESAASPNEFQVGPILTLNGSGAGSANLKSLFSLGTHASIVPGSIEFSDGTNTYTEPMVPNGKLLKNGVVTIPDSTINYATGVVVINQGAPAGVLVGNFSYYPGLPIMGLRDFSYYTKVGATFQISQYPVPLAFDTKYSYQLNQTSASVFFYNVNYFKTSEVPFEWSSGDYQQFWTTNYQSALWATNNVPGLNFVTASYTSGSGSAVITFNFKSGGVNFTDLIDGDLLWFNEWAGGSTINGLVGTVTDSTGAASGNYEITFTGNQTVAGTGIAQLLTNTIPGQDGIKWYDGDPTSGDGIPAATDKGWVNFAPPLTAATVSINDKTVAKYYLVGALAIVPFKDRLVFFSPWIQSSTGSPIQLNDTAIWSWNGTPYYNSVVPTNEIFDGTAYYVDVAGKGGYLSAGIAQPILTVSTNEDVLLVGFGGNGRKTRFVYSGNDLQPFLFFSINTELPSSSTFSSISLDRGAIDLGPYGIAMTDQQSSQRIDLDIPDSVFTIQNLNNGTLRVNAIRDFLAEFIYFNYPLNDSPWRFPTRSFLFNYRDNTWAILYENYTAQGRYRQQIKNNWASIGEKYKSWAGWRVPWNAPSSSALYASIIAGNPQGYVLIRDTGTAESVSGSIAAIADDGGGFTQITSYDHCVQSEDPFLLTGDYLFFSDAIGNTFLNGQIGKVTRIIDANNFVVDVPFVAGTYLGLGQFTRLCQPLLQTKQFNFYWQQGRQTRIAAQKFLMDRTASGQVTIDIYLSQNDDISWNESTVVPDPNSTNNTLIYSQLLYTCPESTNLGLTPANINLQSPMAASGQKQIWHRMNTSLQGDSVQLGITLSDAQMRDITLATSEVVCQGIQFTVAPGPLMA